ncbi:MAG: excinuclease ABC subunit UvrA, partial [Chitinophagaceae bacterium]
ELFEDIRKKGFLKVRVDGEVLDLAPRMQVDRYKIHDIEVVVDRIKVTSEFNLRLSQSVQKALQMGKGLLFILVNDNDEVAQFSRQLMCLDTGISYEEPSPNAFSFNSPYGACPVCKGLGSIHRVNLDAIIPDNSLSVKEGAITPLGEEREAYVYKQVQQLAKKNKFSLDKPVKDLPKSALNLLLYGKEKPTEEIDPDSDEVESEEGSYYSTEYEGVVNMVRRWYTSTNTSESVRQWAEQFMKLHVCPECNGTRLKKESLWFKVNNKNIAELSDMDLDKLVMWFDNIEKNLSERQNAIARDVLKEIRDRLGFLLDVGLTYLTLSRPSRSLSGGEYQRIRLATQIGSQLRGITYILDEPSIGLHQRDNQRLITALKNLRDIGNSVLVVEHDKDIM